MMKRPTFMLLLTLCPLVPARFLLISDQGTPRTTDKRSVNGTIHVDSKPNAGTRIYVWVPLTSDSNVRLTPAN